MAVIEERIASERAFLLEVVGEVLGQALAKEHKSAKPELDDSVRSLNINELRSVIAAERNALIDIPSPLRARVN
jgi:hypothetical protein